jgi:putative DNA primase/helicase
MDDVAQAAIAYASRGWAVIPLHGVIDGVCTCREGQACESPGKHPLWRDWPKQASSDPNTVSGWWAHYVREGKARNVGIVCGASGLVVIDVDSAEGEQTLERLVSGHQLPPTMVAKTRRGRHLYFEGEAPAAKLPGLDIKSGNGFVVAPPSVRVDGGRYEWA